MRFYFDIRDKLAIRDQVGRDLKTVSDAIVYARYLAADFPCLEPDAMPRLSIGSWTRQSANPRGSCLRLDRRSVQSAVHDPAIGRH
jgi:hypothetical protein